MTRTAHILVALALLFALHLPVHAQSEHRKHALLIAISEYPKSSGFDPLHASNDVPPVKAALTMQGFHDADMMILIDGEATQQGIRGALTELTNRVDAGDIVVILYSGHGVRITDDNGDEIDGYDEAFVSYDAVDKVPANSAADRLIRDDEFNRYITELRRNVGKSGNVAVFFDACHSGSGTRGEEEMPVRGRDNPIGLPAANKQASDTTLGLIGDMMAATDKNVLAPYVVFSACRFDQKDHEMRDENGTEIGPLSYALSKELPLATPGSSYRALFERIKTRMASKVMLQEPQLEGDADVKIFSGEVVDQKSYLTVSRRDGDQVVLQGGSLLGLIPGTKLDFHPIGTVNPDKSTPVAMGEVVSSDELQSVVRVDKPIDNSNGGYPWAFVKEYSFGSLKLRVKIGDRVPSSTAAALRQSLQKIKIVEIVTSKPEVMINASAKSSAPIRVSTGEDATIGTFQNLDARSAQDSLIEAIKGYARAKYLRDVTMTDNIIKIKVELVPVELKPRSPGQCNGIARILEPTRNLTKANQWQFNRGDAYMLRITNIGTAPAWIAALDISENGEISQLYPRETISDNILEPGKTLETKDICYVAAAPFGSDVIKVFATRDRVDFRPVVTVRGHSTTKGASHPLEEVLAETYQARGTETIDMSRGAGAAEAITITILDPAWNGKRPAVSSR